MQVVRVRAGLPLSQSGRHHRYAANSRKDCDADILEQDELSMLCREDVALVCFGATGDRMNRWKVVDEVASSKKIKPMAGSNREA